MTMSSPQPPPASSGSGSVLLDSMWLLRRDTFKTMVLALAFLLALSINWAVTDVLRQALITAAYPVLLRALYPLTVAVVLWVARTLTLLR